MRYSQEKLFVDNSRLEDQIFVEQPARELLRRSEQSSLNPRAVACQTMQSAQLSQPYQVLLARTPCLEREREAQHRKETKHMRIEKGVRVARRGEPLIAQNNVLYEECKKHAILDVQQRQRPRNQEVCGRRQSGRCKSWATVHQKELQNLTDIWYWRSYVLRYNLECIQLQALAAYQNGFEQPLNSQRRRQSLETDEK